MCARLALDGSVRFSHSTAAMDQLINATGLGPQTWAVFVCKLGAMDDYLLFNLLTNAEYDVNKRRMSNLSLQ
jgi:hypothetical protein